ncbi:MAG: hypothetical protein M1834_006191 [Cirrosporium novae-zelandiae]|nr:MAG: hypothetical protein M1834_006191 [Cirrosporium novae-zelandiae]
MASANSTTQELTSEDVERLIATLYAPGPPQTIKRAETNLKQIQKLPQAWQFADALLGSQSQNSRFFGALTFTVKINQDLDSLSDADIEALQQRLIGWLVRLVGQGEKPLVIRKLCSTLVSYFLHLRVSWILCIRQVIYSLINGDYVPENAIQELQPQALNLQSSQRLAALWFTSALAEEGARCESNPKIDRPSQIMASLDDAVDLMRICIPSTRDGFIAASDPTVTQEALRCLQSWIQFSHRTYVDHSTLIPTLKSLIQPTIQCLVVPHSFDPASECLVDLFWSFPAFASQSDYDTFAELVRGDWGQTYMAHLQDFSPEAEKFAKLVSAYGTAEVENLARNYEKYQSIMPTFHSLITLNGYPVEDDMICFQGLDFWLRWAENVQDALFEEESTSEPWMQSAILHLGRAVEAFRRKIIFPPLDTWHDMPGEDREEFKSFRRDVQDLLQAAYPMLGIDLLQHIVREAVSSLENKAWDELEANLFCLSSVSDAIATGAAEDSTLKNIFGSKLFATLSDFSVDTDKFSRQRASRETAHLTGEFRSFFERYPEYLPSALNFLFASLERASVDSGQRMSLPDQLTVIDAIEFLCQSCRKFLIDQCEKFINQYETVLAGSHLSTVTKSKLLGAIAAIIQAVPWDEAKRTYLERLLQTVIVRIKLAIHIHDQDPNSQDEVAQTIAVEALNNLGGVAKGYQSADDEPIDLDAEPSPANFWNTGPGAGLQAGIVECLVTVTRIFGRSGEITDAICEFLRVGLKEQTPGPFVLLPGVTCNYVTFHGLDTPRLDMILGTACMLINSHNSGSSTRIDNEAKQIFTHVTSLIVQLQDPSTDPEIAQACVDVLDSLINRYNNILLDPETLHTLQSSIKFALDCLNGPDILPKRSAASFWAKLLRLDSTTSPKILKPLILSTGPYLSRVLIFNIGGSAARSELDFLAEPLRALVFRMGDQAARWFNDCMKDPQFPGQKVDEKKKSEWISKIIA